MATYSGDFNRVLEQVLLNELADEIHMPYLDLIMPMIAIAPSVRRPPVLGTARIESYVGETVPSYSDPLFKAHFRMTRSSFQALLELIGPHTAVRTISLERRTLACIWYLSNTESFRSVVDRFGLSKGSLHYYLGNFCRLLSGEKILPTMITWPKQEEYASIAESFSQRAGFPGVIGAIDGTYIPISGPTAFRDSYICRKGFPAFHLQAVCDSRLRFLNVFSAYPGSVHDSRVYKNSPLYGYLELEAPSQYHLLGDSAYGLSTNMLVPFRDNGHLTTEEKTFNYKQSSTRVDIERCFGLLKGKFRKLKFLDMRSVADIPSVIVACCVVHNFILSMETINDAEIIVEIEGGSSETLVSTETSTAGSAKRRDIMNLLA